jgi:hypothetical protein
MKNGWMHDFVATSFSTIQCFMHVPKSYSAATSAVRNARAISQSMSK